MKAAAKAIVSRNEAGKICYANVTRTFRHLLSVERLDRSRRARMPKDPFLMDPGEKVLRKLVPPKERIKWWNIVPGDQARIMAEKDGRVREVKGINKFTNRVFLEGDKKPEQKFVDDLRFYARIRNPFKNVHYSGLQLYLGDYEFPPLPGSDEKRSLPVFALRLGSTEPRWEDGRWIWERYATATVPRLPSRTPGIRERIVIPWPEPKKHPITKPTKYDTPNEVVAEVTYVPTQLPTKYESNVLIPDAAKEDEYVLMLRSEIPYSQDYPMEVFLAKELSNPHSRIKKRERYLATRARQRALLKQFVEEEVKKPIEGRTKREAIAEATFRWREHLRLARKAELKRRWVQRGLQARLERKRKRTNRKQELIKRRLSELVLQEAPNQVVPKH